MKNRTVELLFDKDCFCCGIDVCEEGIFPIFKMRATTYLKDSTLIGMSIEEFIGDNSFELRDGKHLLGL